MPYEVLRCVRKSQRRWICGFNVSVPALGGCFTQGDTEKEAFENAREADFCYFEGLKKINQIKAKLGVILRENGVSL